MTVLLGVDPNLVRPGWTPLVVLILLGIVLFFLGRSMLKQFGKIDVPADHEPTEELTVTEPDDGALPDLRRESRGSAAGERTTPSDHA
jgi:hypothetical protein